MVQEDVDGAVGRRRMVQSEDVAWCSPKTSHGAVGRRRMVQEDVAWCRRTSHGAGGRRMVQEM